MPCAAFNLQRFDMTSLQRNVQSKHAGTFHAVGAREWRVLYPRRILGRAHHLCGCERQALGLLRGLRLRRKSDCRSDKNEADPKHHSHTSNETEISHGRVLWQAHWTCFAMGPLASSIG